MSKQAIDWVKTNGGDAVEDFFESAINRFTQHAKDNNVMSKEAEAVAAEVVEDEVVAAVEVEETAVEEVTEDSVEAEDEVVETEEVVVKEDSMSLFVEQIQTMIIKALEAYDQTVMAELRSDVVELKDNLNVIKSKQNDNNLFGLNSPFDFSAIVKEKFGNKAEVDSGDVVVEKENKEVENAIVEDVPVVAGSTNVFDGFLM